MEEMILKIFNQRIKKFYVNKLFILISRKIECEMFYKDFSFLNASCESASNSMCISYDWTGLLFRQQVLDPFRIFVQFIKKFKISRLYFSISININNFVVEFVYSYNEFE